MTKLCLPDLPDDDSPTEPYVPLTFLGQRVPPHSAELPLPDPRVCGLGETQCDTTVDERRRA